ncbi:uncharacterized protein LOC125828025 [Solanum verrucosum]|uniref:uncharacterized protein LOC125828025 n=1 Tax=Solanum verrucosum TaxID=315347 RepID=UPI0020D0D7A1|nr:uncharacterized protein LOC125828025 [Solanum verrucosum]
MLDIGIDGSRPILRINVNARPPIEPTNSYNDDNNFIGNERLGDHSKESLGDNSNKSLSDHSVNMHDDPLNMENQPVDVKDPEPEYCEEMQEEQGFAHMRKVIAVDDTHLHGKYGGVLLSVVAQDTKNHVYPVVFCVVDKENDGSWIFFFERLKEIMVDEPELCFISDRHKSIPNKFKNKFPTEVVIPEHDIGFEKRSMRCFPGNGYDVMTTNIAESLNVMLIDEREYPVAYIFNSIAKRFGEFFRERHAYILKSIDVTINVNLLEKSCSCSEYDLIKITCAHAMAALRSKHGNEYGMSIYLYSLTLYKVEAYLLAYMDSINVVPLKSQWCVPEELLNVNIFLPLVDIKLGIKRRKRVKGIGENFKSKRRNKCSICKRTRHKRTTCVNNKS